ncbi:amidase domain-containing protein, partial [Paramaledivibacter caminithermalis]
KSIDIKNDYAKVVLEINLDEQQAYPPFISSGKNVFELRKDDNSMWKIVEHEYISLRMFESSKEKLLSEKKKDELFKTIEKEYIIDKTKEYKNYNQDEEQSGVVVLSLPAENHYYSSSRGVYYANKYVENRNTKFYEASTSGGDCTNFASQVSWYGFGANDTTQDISNKVMMVPGSTYTEGWYAGSGGGSRNWESVNYFWNYMTGYKSIDTPGPRVSVVSSVSSLNEGGIMQIDFEYDSDYDHTVILVDKDTLKFAQHSYNGYYYYSDYSGSKRFFNPSYFREIL